MPLKPLAYRVVRRKLLAAGFMQVSQKGSHAKFAKPTNAGIRTAIVPIHSEVRIGTLRSILRQAGIAAEEFERL